jgi:selenocysteine-specific elongation factor
LIVFSVLKALAQSVTGTLITGKISIGDEMEILPGDQKRARVRGLQSHGSSLTEAHAGERTAVNLQGLNLDEVSRGHVVASSGRFVASSLIDVSLESLASSPTGRFGHGQRYDSISGQPRFWREWF